MDDFDFDNTPELKRFNRLRSLARLFRFIELFAAIALLTWLSTRAPLAFKVSGDYFRRLSTAVTSPLFVFFLGNAIVVALFAKSGRTKTDEKETEAESEELSSNVPAASPEKKMDKEIVEEVKTVDEEPSRVSESDKIVREICEEDSAETDSSVEVEDSDSEEVMSSDEFRRTIEAFIAKQVKFIREESSHSLLIHT